MDRTAVDQRERVRAEFRRNRAERLEYEASRRNGAGEIFARALFVVAVLALLVCIAVPKVRDFAHHVSEVIDGPSRP